MNSLILAAAGCGRRIGNPKNKLLIEAAGQPLVWYTLKHILQSRLLDELVLVVKAEERAEFEKIAASLSPQIPVRYAKGGKTREDSVWNGMCAVSPDTEKILIHDGARPLITGKAIDDVIRHLDTCDAAILGLPCTDTIKETNGKGCIVRTCSRSLMYRAQTPQGFRLEPFRKAFERFRSSGKSATDDAAVAEMAGIPVEILPGSETFFKVTVPADLDRFLSLVSGNIPMIRIGHGYDTHRFKKGRPLILGGTAIPSETGLDGHSDADVLIHAVMDALLGAAGLPDIGTWFPDTDPAWEGVSSMFLLEKVREIVYSRGYRVSNVDTTVVAEMPKLAPYVNQMRANIAQALQIESSCVGVKATTNEKMDAIGRGEGMAAFASVLLIGGTVNG